MEHLSCNNVNDVAEKKEYLQVKSFKTENDASTFITGNSPEMDEYKDTDHKDIVFEQAFIKCEMVDDEVGEQFTSVVNSQFNFVTEICVVCFSYLQISISTRR